MLFRTSLVLCTLVAISVSDPEPSPGGHGHGGGHGGGGHGGGHVGAHAVVHVGGHGGEHAQEHGIHAQHSSDGAHSDAKPSTSEHTFGEHPTGALRGVKDFSSNIPNYNFGSNREIYVRSMDLVENGLKQLPQSLKDKLKRVFKDKVIPVLRKENHLPRSEVVKIAINCIFQGLYSCQNLLTDYEEEEPFVTCMKIWITGDCIINDPATPLTDKFIDNIFNILKKIPQKQ